MLERTIELERIRATSSGSSQAACRRCSIEPLANELTRGEALRFGALLHDVAKPATRAVTETGRVTFLGHDEGGAEIAAEVLGACGRASG